MEHDHLSFPEALEQLAKRAGITLLVAPGERSAADHDRLYRAHEIALALYRRTLDSPQGAKAREEIARRCLDPKVAQEYRLGAAPEAWDSLVSQARSAGLGADVLERAGLAIRRESGSGHYDRFRGRLMFPIESMGPRVVAFGGRILDEGEPKYLNSPETQLFRKRKTLYGLPQASAALREKREAILVEGYMDVLALASAGFRNTVGALGTAFTEGHAQMLSRVVQRVTVVFDGDEAGDKAMVASAGPLLAAGLEVRVVPLPRGEDPDSYVRSAGVDAFRAALEKSRGIIDALLGDDAYESAPARDRAVRRALSALGILRDPLRRRFYIQEVASRTGLSEDVLSSRLEDGKRPHGVEEEEEKRPTPPRKIDAHDQTFLGLVLHDQDAREQLLAQFGAEEFEDPVVHRIVKAMNKLHATGGPVSTGSVLDSLGDDDEARALLGMVAVSETAALKTQERALDCARRLELRALQNRSALILQSIRKANAAADEHRLKQLNAEYSELKQRIQLLNRRNSAGELTPPGRTIC
jgi:DNA primase